MRAITAPAARRPISPVSRRRTLPSISISITTLMWQPGVRVWAGEGEGTGSDGDGVCVGTLKALSAGTGP